MMCNLSTLHLPAALLLSGALLLTGCTEPSDAPSDAPTPDDAEATASAEDVPTDTARYHTTGVVRSVLPDEEQIIIHHDDIPGFMDAMTMPFGLDDPDLAASVEPRDSVAFTFEAYGNTVRITALERLP